MPRGAAPLIWGEPHDALNRPAQRARRYGIALVMHCRNIGGKQLPRWVPNGRALTAEPRIVKADLAPCTSRSLSHHKHKVPRDEVFVKVGSGASGVAGGGAGQAMSR